MAFHPRQNYHASSKSQGMSRRDFITRAAAMGLAFPTLSAFLAACGDGGATDAVQVVIGSPANPVTQPLLDSNQMISSGLPAEAGPLRIYNWADYLNPETIPLAEEALGTSIELTTFFNEEEALQKLISGEVNFDVFFPVAGSIPKVVAGQLIQPLNHEYLPNLSNIWPQLADPFYDKGSQYTVPYTVYSTGIAWRNDMVDDADVTGIDNAWDVFWNPKYADIPVGLYDDFRETLGAALYRNGVTEVHNATQAEIDQATADLIELIDLTDIKYTIDGAYAGIPEGRFGVHMAWSGDMVSAPYYFPEDGDPSVTRYAWPAQTGSSVHGQISSDTMTVLKGSENPVLAHQFLNFMLDEDQALTNFGWVGYQPPQKGLDVDYLVADEWVPEYLSSAIVRPEDFSDPRASVPIALTADQEAKLLDAWTKVQSGG